MTLEKALRIAAGELVPGEPKEDLLVAWTRLQERSQLEPPQQRERNLTDAEMARWHAYFEGLLASQRDFILEVMGEALGETLDQISDEIDAKIAESQEKAALARLQDSVDELRRDLKGRGNSRDEVVDLPNPLPKHVN
jgi:hypothetical protein